jgi:hypothetical protein
MGGDFRNVASTSLRLSVLLVGQQPYRYTLLIARLRRGSVGYREDEGSVSRHYTRADVIFMLQEQDSPPQYRFRKRYWPLRRFGQYVNI